MAKTIHSMYAYGSLPLQMNSQNIKQKRSMEHNQKRHKTTFDVSRISITRTYTVSVSMFHRPRTFVNKPSRLTGDMMDGFRWEKLITPWTTANQRCCTHLPVISQDLRKYPPPSDPLIPHGEYFTHNKLKFKPRKTTTAHGESLTGCDVCAGAACCCLATGTRAPAGRFPHAEF